MSEAIDWPSWATKTPSSERENTNKFSSNFRTSKRDLKAEMRRMDVDRWTLEDVTGSSGFPGVVVRWTVDGVDYAVACDRYTAKRDNLRESYLWIKETRKRALELADTLGDQVPVITGFLAEGPEGSVTTLGRGGSDTSAVMLGNYMNADEVVIVTDVEGVMTGDPRVVEGARNVGKISVDELRNLSFRGAEVVAPSALSYKDGKLSVRVVHYQHGDLLTGGTSVEGEFQNLVDMRERPLACLTVAGRAIRNEPGVFQSLSTALGENELNIDAVASGLDTITFYLDVDDAQKAENILHREVIASDALSSITVEKDLAVIRVTGGELPNQPGIIREIVNPLADARINVHDLITSATSVAIFVAWDDREATLEITQNLF